MAFANRHLPIDACDGCGVWPAVPLDELHRMFKAAKLSSAASQNVKWRYSASENRAALVRLLANSFAKA